MVVVEIGTEAVGVTTSSLHVGRPSKPSNNPNKQTLNRKFNSVLRKTNELALFESATTGNMRQMQFVLNEIKTVTKDFQVTSGIAQSYR